MVSSLKIAPVLANFGAEISRHVSQCVSFGSANMSIGQRRFAQTGVDPSVISKDFLTTQ